MDTNTNGAMSALNGTKTQSNLNTAFDDEAKSYAKYKLYAQKAHEEGHHAHARAFDETAENERQHAYLWLGYLDGIMDTSDNLDAAILMEQQAIMGYPEMAKTADEEGFSEIAEKMRLMARTENTHLNTFNKMADELAGKTPEYDADTHWVCTNCGFDTHGNIKPDRCPLCSYPKEYIEQM